MEPKGVSSNSAADDHGEPPEVKAFIEELAEQVGDLHNLRRVATLMSFCSHVS
jgi:hypothetical protein